MAKASDKSAGALDADKAGLLTGLFAEENEFDRRALWRIGTWGLAAVGAVVLAVTSNQWSIGIKRDQLAAADLAQQAQRIQSLTKESQNETRRLAAAIDMLDNDRDRLFSRVTVLEQGLDSVTGTIAKETAAANSVPKPPPSVAPPPATLMLPSAPPAGNRPSQASPPNQAAAPAVAPVASAAPTTPVTDKPRADAAKPDPAPGAIASLPQIAAIKPAVPLAPPPAPAPAFGAVKSMMGPPDPAASRLVEVAKPANAAPAATAAPASAQPSAEIAALSPEAKGEAKNNVKNNVKTDAKPQDEEKDQDKSQGETQDKSQDASKDQKVAPADADAAKVQRTEFAVELGGANSIPGLRALWRGLLKSRNAELAELRPIIVLREGNNGLGMQLRLAAGPLQNAAEAAKICAALAESKRICSTTVFDGQRLAIGADEEPATNSKPPAQAKPSSYRHYYGPRHVKKEEPPPPPKPESSTFSSLFGLNKH